MIEPMFHHPCVHLEVQKKIRILAREVHQIMLHMDVQVQHVDNAHLGLEVDVKSSSEVRY